MQGFITAIWIAILGLVVAVLSVPESRALFGEATQAYPFTMGFFKIAILGTMGELLGGRIALGRWRLSGIRLHQRILIWGLFGWVFTVVFPLFSFGVDGLLSKGLIPGRGVPFVVAFWKSFFMNMIFAFPMMVTHRITDTLIERGQLFSLWPLVEVFSNIDWKNMFHIVGTSCLWFWIPAHTFTFTLPAEFRVVCAALLAVALGCILGLAKKRAAQKS